MDYSAEAAYQRTPDELAQQLDSDLNQGLTPTVAAQRLREVGPNELASTPPEPAWRRFLAQFQDTLVILLLIATAISAGIWLYERDSALPYEALVIFAIVLLNGILGFVQEERAEHAVAALRAMAAAKAVVLRGGERQAISASEIVPGDIMVLEEGDTIPADGRLFQATALKTAEAALTGESLPVSKSLDPMSGEQTLGDQHTMVFSGTAVTYGRGRAIVTATAMDTEMGRVANMLQDAQSEATPLQKELDRTGKVLGIVVLAIAVIVVITIILVEGVHDFSTLVEVLILGVALAVAAVPEGLPAIVTAVLAIGVQRMARRNAIVRKLPAVETLGSATIIASDKTGTLTKNEMTVRTIVTASGRVDLSGTGYAPSGELSATDSSELSADQRTEAERILRAAERANNAALQQRDGRWSIQGDPTEGALIVAARKAGIEQEQQEQRFARVGEVPFSSERKLMSTVHADSTRQERLIVFSKGAPDVLLGRCSHELVGKEARPLSDERRQAILAQNEQLAAEALRTLGVAFRSLPPNALDNQEPDAETIEADLVFLGLIGMIDPPRPEAAEAVRRAQHAGIRPLMITGDHPQTALAIAKELGITNNNHALTGQQLAQLDDAALREQVQDVSVYARVNPEHKLRIVEALQQRGHVVAMTGDGVNDAPALKTANIGVAMGITGTDVSKEAADMVLTDDNFASIVAAVEEGRGIFSNIQKFLRYLLSSNIGEVLTMFWGVILAGVLGLTGQGETVVLPLLATQLLWINLVTDGAPALALGLDPVDHIVMDRPPRQQGSGVITRQMWIGIAWVGLIMATGTLLVLDLALPKGLISGSGNLTYARTMAFTTLMLFQLFNTFNARSDTNSAFRAIASNPWLWGAVALSLALHMLVIYLPLGQRAFSVTALTIMDWLICVGVASSVLWLREIEKWVRRRTATAH